MNNWILTRTVALLVIAVGMASGALAQQGSQLEAVKARGTLVVGVRADSPPFGFIDEGGKNAGIDVEIAKEFSKRLGTKLELVQVTAQSRIPMLNSGKIDVLLAALTHTREREKAIDFSVTYLTDAIKMLVKKGSPIKGPEDLGGKTIGFTQGSTIAQAIKSTLPADVRVLQYQEHPQALLALRQGLTDAYFNDVLNLEKMIQADPGFEIVGPEFAAEPMAAGIRRNDSDWRNAINAMLQDMVKDGTWDKIIKTFVQVQLSRPEVWP